MAHAALLAPRFGIYVHVPYCLSVCPYCDFNVYVGSAADADAYLDAVLIEADTRRFELRGEAGTVFLGGGTPSLISPPALRRFLDSLRSILPVSPGAEITLEANPETVTVSSLEGYRTAGVNRLSLGVQSFAPHVLSALGRTHTPPDAGNAVAFARSAGFDNVSVDLIFGTAGESLADWSSTLSSVVASGVDHVSCYGLTIEDGTAFGAAVTRGALSPPDEDDLASKYEMACEMLPLRHYEISNWGEPSRHNLIYWTQGDYLGLGAGAHSHREGLRSWNRRLPRAYMTDPAHPVAGSEELGDAGKAREWLLLRLRLVDGVDLAQAAIVLDVDVRSLATPIVEAGLAVMDGDVMKLTPRGLLLENEIALRLGAA
ncbi:MAG TPA: radical SAM family heme chaperone HemW [Actinomycetota bacterium]|nr:radical SAM family heme chaperone HemW [Actinomycetota bacterium]